VGANRSHRVQSPLFPDGTFELVPIPESEKFQAEPLPRYREIRCFNRDGFLAEYLPHRYADVHAHLDPDFDRFTYGDLCHYAPRAAGLKIMQPGDLLFFLARLVPYRESGFEDSAAGFFLVGALEIEEIFADIRNPPSQSVLRRIGQNAHVLRGLSNPAYFDGFWVFAGTKKSLRFHKAVRLDRDLAGKVFRDSSGHPWHWGAKGEEKRRSELQVIGSYTRSCRMVIDPQRQVGQKAASHLCSAIRAKNPHFPWQT